MRTLLLSLAALLALSALLPSASARPDLPPLVGVCVDDVTHDGCWHGGTVCVGFSYQIPTCVYGIAPELGAAPGIPPVPFGYCAGVNACDDGAEVCVGAFHWVPQCADVPCADRSCIELSPIPVPASVCAKLDGCWGGHDVCVSAFSWVPQCADVPCTDNECFDVAGPCVSECMAGPEPMCMYYYYEIDTGIVRYVQRDSCHNEIYVDGERVK